MTDEARTHLQAGRLRSAVQAMTAEVRSKPREASARNFLGQLLCLTGDLERADLQFETLLQQQPDLAPGLTLMRQLIRGERARRQFFSEGRAPEFLVEPPEHVRLRIQAAVLAREGKDIAAAELLERAEEARPHPTGTCAGKPFDDLRDLDDLTASFLEVLTSAGKYFIVPVERIVRVEFSPPERPCDLLWRRVQMSVLDGPEGQVYIPAIYAPMDELDEDSLLGRATSWSGRDGAPTRGIGQRCFLIGDEDVPIMELTELALAQPGA